MPKFRVIYKFSLIFFSFFIFRSEAQTPSQLKGIWKGTLKDSMTFFDYTLRIDKIFGNKFFGSSISSNESFYCETKVMGNIDRGKISVYEAEIAKTNYKNKAGICLLALNVSLENGKLIGKFRPITNTTNCLSGIVNLLYKEAIPELQKKEILANQETSKNRESISGIPNTVSTQNHSESENWKLKNLILEKREAELPSAFSSRTLLLIRELKIDANEAEISLYDNGIVDGDSITLVDNNIPIFQKAELSTKALKYVISNKVSDVHNIAFFADNLGSIPPNTGLMVIIANNKRWEINFSSDYSKTSFVKIILSQTH